MVPAALAAAIAKQAETSPQNTQSEGIVPGRLLLADGDGLCYYCAGNDETAPGQARINLLDKLRSAARSCGAERIKVLVTGAGSHKGYRYAVARVKPYQGHRTGNHRPKNWQFLRELLEQGDLPPDIEIEFTHTAEADDLFSRYAEMHPDCVIFTQDKDMRMVPGKHLEWKTHILTDVPPCWVLTAHDLVYGRQWFWMQMLHGDAADNIPGLPWYTDGSINKSGLNKGKVKEIRCGEASSAVKGLDKVSSDMGACIYLQGLYRTCYGERWLVNMLEQGILLWMRTDMESNPFDVTKPGHPLHPLTSHADWPAARQEILIRIAEGQINEKTEDHGSGTDQDSDAAGAGEPLQSVQSAVCTEPSGAGPRSPDGCGAGSAAPGMQRPAGQGGEQPQAVRGAVPGSVPQWMRRLSAKA
jgi:DNA polymerase-1